MDVVEACCALAFEAIVGDRVRGQCIKLHEVRPRMQALHVCHLDKGQELFSIFKLALCFQLPNILSVHLKIMDKRVSISQTSPMQWQGGGTPRGDHVVQVTLLPISIRTMPSMYPSPINQYSPSTSVGRRMYG